MSTHVLIAEDSEIVLDALKLLLEAHGFRVSVAVSVDAAIARCNEDFVDVLLLDLNLGDRDGLDVLREIGSSDRAPRNAIALTGHDASEIHADALAAGCREVWLKPVPARELIARIHKLVG